MKSRGQAALATFKIVLIAAAALASIFVATKLLFDWGGAGAYFAAVGALAIAAVYRIERRS